MAEAISELAVIALLVSKFSNRVSMGYFITDDAKSAATGNWMGGQGLHWVAGYRNQSIFILHRPAVSDKLEEIFAKFLDSLNNSE